MDARGKLFTLFQDCNNPSWKWFPNNAEMLKLIEYLVANGVTVQECAYWQYIDDVDEDNNIQAYCSVCHAGDKHATSMIGKVPYCWKCGRKMMPQPPKGE